MHFFIDHNLPSQNSADTYGADSSDPTNKFNITSRFQLTGQTKAFACQDSLMIVQQSSVDSSLVNVILKPIEGLKIPFRSVKYFVYRGLLKSSFISGTAITPQATTNSEFIARFWTDWNNYKTNTNQQTLTDPTPQTFGYDNTLAGTIDIENIYDNSQIDVRALLVKEGEWIGDFGNSFKIGLEIITEADNLNLDLDFLRAEKHQIDVSGFFATAFEKRATREQILSFIDPAAFFGLHYDSGVYISTYSGNIKTTVKKKQNDIYSFLLDNKFVTKNRVYLDIRSEKGFSYNFYQNYDDGSANNIKIGNSAITPVAQSYSTNDWPIVFIDTPAATSANNNDIKINLRDDDNTKPILFFENTNLLNGNNRSRFLDETKILNGAGWSKDLSFIFPNTGTGSNKDNVAYYINLNYFRQEFNPSSPSAVLKNEKDIDNIFGTLDMRFLGNPNHSFQHSVNPDIFFLKGQFPSLEKFSYVAESGAYYDSSRVAFYVQMGFPYKNSRRFYQNTGSSVNPGINLNGNFNKMSFLTKDIGITKIHIQEVIAPSTYQKVGILDIFSYNGFPASEENVFLLGLNQTEFATLKNVTGLSDKHPRYIVFEDVSVPPFLDKDGRLFRKYRLKVQGLDSNGDSDIKTPPSDVFVYTTRGFVFASKDFAQAETAVNPSYNRNYEEKIGYDNKESVSGKKYEDFFIEKDNSMKTLVDNFASALNNINASSADAFADIKTLVETSAKNIFDQAVIFVQASNNANPDDRPLYWARTKMLVALKQHPYFTGEYDIYSIVNRSSNLDLLVTLFEEKSRNYLEVDFSAQPTLKKILITGFDPFFLNQKLNPRQHNILQSNPSGCVALSLHNTLTANGLGYIQAMIVPVRYTDFDSSTDRSQGQGEGIIEKYIKPWIGSVDMIITISQSLPDDYNIDKYATATRGGTIDNLGCRRNIPSFGRCINIDGKPELEWLETTLPSQFINPPVILDQKYTDKNGVPSTNIAALPIQTGVQIRKGSGGNYLSNEIFYRVSLLRNQWIKSQLPTVVTKPTGHFHISKLQDEDIGEDFSIIETQQLLGIVKAAINNGVTGL